MRHIDLPEAVKALVSSGIAEVALETGGTVCWQSGSTLGSGRVEAEPTLSPFTTIKFPHSDNPFHMQCLGQAGLAAHFENGLLHGVSRVPYVRAYLSPIIASFAETRVTLYPELKLYKDGILLTQFRVLSGGTCDLDWFIEKYVNLQSLALHAIQISPSILNEYARIRSSGWALNPVRRWLALRALRKTLAQNTASIELGDFTHKLVPVSSDFLQHVRTSGDPLPSLRLLAQYIETCVHQRVFKAVRVVGLRAALAPENVQGDSWSGRPSIYLLDHEGRQASASAMLARHRVSLAKIASRTTVEPLEPDVFLQTNCRTFDDYVVFVERSATIFVLADRESVARTYQPQELSTFVIEKHVQSEFIEHLHASQRFVDEQARAPKTSLGDLLASERALDDIERRLSESSPFLELVQLFRQAQKAFEHERIREAVRAETSAAGQLSCNFLRTGEVPDSGGSWL